MNVLYTNGFDVVKETIIYKGGDEAYTNLVKQRISPIKYESELQHATIVLRLDRSKYSAATITRLYTASPDIARTLVVVDTIKHYFVKINVLSIRILLEKYLEADLTSSNFFVKSLIENEILVNYIPLELIYDIKDIGRLYTGSQRLEYPMEIKYDRRLDIEVAGNIRDIDARMGTILRSDNLLTPKKAARLINITIRVTDISKVLVAIERDPNIIIHYKQIEDGGIEFSVPDEYAHTPVYLASGILTSDKSQGEFTLTTNVKLIQTLTKIARRQLLDAKRDGEYNCILPTEHIINTGLLSIDLSHIGKLVKLKDPLLGRIAETAVSLAMHYPDMYNMFTLKDE